MADIVLRFNRDTVVVDGAMGSLLLAEGIDPGLHAMLLNVIEPDLIEAIHRRYIMAGAQAITTNTFAGSRTQLAAHHLDDQLEDLNRRAVRLARRCRPEHVLADVGPCGLLLPPFGEAGFDEVFDVYAQQIAALAAEQPDAILIETMTDINDARIACLAARATCDLPVFVSLSFSASGYLELSATDARTAAVILEAAGADVIGINCSLGPDEIKPLLQQMAEFSRLPLLVQPNAGLPQTDALGNTIYKLTPDQMAQAAWEFRQMGAQFIGSCCGTTPSHTAAIYAAVGGTDVARVRRGARRAGALAGGAVAAGASGTAGGAVAGAAAAGAGGTAAAGGAVVAASSAGAAADSSKNAPRSMFLSSAGTLVEINSEGPCLVIGERINPNGKPALVETLAADDYSLAISLAQQQIEAGANLIDVNVFAKEIDAKTTFAALTAELAAYTPAVLVLDCLNARAIEAALRVYPGRALINAVNGSPERMQRLLPMAAEYGAAIIALCTDGTRLPADTDELLQIAEQIREAALAVGLTDNDIMYDALTMAQVFDEQAFDKAIDAVRAFRARGWLTVLAISNISYQAENKSQLNAAFVSAVVEAGLNAAILNPNDAEVMAALRTANAVREQAQI